MEKTKKDCPPKLAKCESLTWHFCDEEKGCLRFPLQSGGISFDYDKKDEINETFARLVNLSKIAKERKNE